MDKNFREVKGIMKNYALNIGLNGWGAFCIVFLILYTLLVFSAGYATRAKEENGKVFVNHWHGNTEFTDFTNDMETQKSNANKRNKK